MTYHRIKKRFGITTKSSSFQIIIIAPGSCSPDDWGKVFLFFFLSFLSFKLLPLCQIWQNWITRQGTWAELKSVPLISHGTYSSVLFNGRGDNGLQIEKNPVPTLTKQIIAPLCISVTIYNAGIMCYHRFFDT